MLYNWAKSFDSVRCEIVVKSSEDLLRDAAIVGSVAIVLSFFNVRFIGQYVSVAIRNTHLFLRHLTGIDVEIKRIFYGEKAILQKYISPSAASENRTHRSTKLSL